MKITGMLIITMTPMSTSARFHTRSMLRPAPTKISSTATMRNTTINCLEGTRFIR